MAHPTLIGTSQSINMDVLARRDFFHKGYGGVDFVEGGGSPGNFE
jgi:nitrogenase subunit NifH